MKKDLQTQFFSAYIPGGIVGASISLIRDKYDLWLIEKENGNSLYKIKINEIIEKQARKDVEAFDETILVDSNSSLLSEIEDNLLECKTNNDKERYLYSIIVEFKELSALLYPEMYFKKYNEEMLKKSQKNKLIWEQSQMIEAKEQLEAIAWMVQDEQNRMDRLNNISEKFWQIATQPKDDEIFIEKIFRIFFELTKMFANRLDALCLKYGIDLLKLQDDCGVWLKSTRFITDVDYYIGSMELAKKYISELPKRESQNQSKPLLSNFIRQFKAGSLRTIFEELKKWEFIPIKPDYNHFEYTFNSIDKPEGYNGLKWLKNKQLLREFLTSIKKPEIILADMERAVPDFFIDKNGKPITLANAKEVPNTDSDKIQNMLKNQME